MITYATTADLPTGLERPGNVETLLARASHLVRRATMCDIYPTFKNGAPSCARVAATFRAATVSQVVAWITAGIDPDVADLTGTPVRSGESLLGGSIQYAGADTIIASRQASTVALTAQALAVLQAEGLAGAEATARG